MGLRVSGFRASGFQGVGFRSLGGIQREYRGSGQEDRSCYAGLGEVQGSVGGMH